MGFTMTFRKIIIITVILVSIVSAGFYFFNIKEKNALKIVSLDIFHSEGESNYTVTVKVKNTGSNDIVNAIINFIFIKDNEMVDSEKQLLNLQINLAHTCNATFIGIPFNPKSTYTAIVTIYLKDTLLDSQTLTR